MTSVGKIALFYRTTILGILNNIRIIDN